MHQHCISVRDIYMQVSYVQFTPDMYICSVTGLTELLHRSSKMYSISVLGKSLYCETCLKDHPAFRDYTSYARNVSGLSAQVISIYWLKYTRKIGNFFHYKVFSLELLLIKNSVLLLILINMLHLCKYVCMVCIGRDLCSLEFSPSTKRVIFHCSKMYSFN